MVRAMMSSVSPIISAATSNGSVIPRQRAKVASVHSAMVATNPAMRLLWKAGAAMRRWRRQNSPSLMRSPSPSSGPSARRKKWLLP